MPSSLPIKFEGFDIEIQERASDLDRTNEASGIVQGKIIKWQMVERNDGDGGSIYKTDFVGEDAEGRLLFSGVDVTTSCFSQQGSTRKLISKIINQGIVRGIIEMGPDQFGPGAKYKIAVTVRARVTAPIRYLTQRNCEEGPRSETTPCVLFIATTPGIATTPRNETLGLVSSPTIPNNNDGSSSSVTDVNLTVETEAIDFNSQFPGQGVIASFAFVGQRISINKVILSKKVF